MDSKIIWAGLLVVGVGVAVVAGLRSSSSSESARPEPQAQNARPGEPGALGAPGALPPGHPPVGNGNAEPPSPAMPPGHPPVPGAGAGAMPGSGAGMAGAGAGAAASPMAWTVPARWKEAPNPSSMRLATYKIPKSGADAEDAEMSVSQAGGGTTANLDRWVGQFDEAAQKTVKKSERTVSGFKTTLVELEGTFASGGMMGGSSSPKPGFALIGAIVETPGMAHFFKLTGPAATVKAARAEVDALLGSIKPK